MARARQPVKPLLFAFIGGAPAKIVELFDQAGFAELVERAVERRRPETGAAVREFLHGAGDAQAVQVRIRQRQQDQVDAVLPALYQTI